MSRRAPALAALLASLAGVACPPSQVVRPDPRGPEADPSIARPPAALAVPGPRPATGDRPVVAIVIDDLGESWEQVAPFLLVPAPLSLAVLPVRAEARPVALRLAAAGRDVLVHVPMEPLDASQMDAPEYLLAAMPTRARLALLERLLDRVPGARGANNHMGSRLVADAAAMEEVMVVLRRRGLYFLDSRTAPGSVAPDVARAAGVPVLERDVFLDNDPTLEAVGARLAELAALARERGCAVGIGHPKAVTAAALMRFALDPGRDVDLVPASRLPGRACRRTAAP